MNKMTLKHISAMTCAVLFLWALLHSPAYAITGIEYKAGAPKFSTGHNRSDFIDMRIKHIGGELTYSRHWTGKRWVSNRHWSPLLLIRNDDPSYPADVNKLTDAQIASMTAGDELPDYILRKGEMYVLRTLYKGRALYQHFYGYTISVTYEDPQADSPVVTGYLWENGKGMQKQYDTNGRLQWSGESNKGKLHFSYNAAGDLHTIKDQGQQTLLTFSYQDIPLTEKSDYDRSSYRLTQLQDYSGRVVEYSYQSGTGKLSNIKDVLGHSWQQTYNDKHYTGFIDPEGRKTTIDIDLEGRLRSYINSEGVGKTYRYHYNKAEQRFMVEVREGSGKATQSHYDFSGLVIERSVSGEVSRRMIYQEGSNGQQMSTSDVASTARKYRRVWVSTKQGAAEVSDCELYEQNDEFLPPHCQPVEILHYVKKRSFKDGRGHVTTYYYNRFREVVRIDYPDDTRYEKHQRHFQGFGRKTVKEVFRNGVVNTFSYNDNALLLEQIEAEGSAEERKTGYSYNPEGLQISVTYYGSGGTEDVTWQYEYDNFGNVSKVIDPYNHETVYGNYDALGNAQHITDANGKLWQMQYDAVGNLLDDTNPYGQGSHFSYDKTGFITSSTQDSGDTYQLMVNADGLPTDIKDSLNHSRKLNYDKDNRPIFMQDANGNIQQFIYDNRGRIQSYKDGEGNQTRYSYHDSLLTKVQYPSYSESYSYDKVGRLIESRQTGEGNINDLRKRGYDIKNNLETSTDANSHLSTTVKDKLGRIIRFTDNAGGITAFSYDSRDNLLQVTDPEQRTTTYSYNLRDELTSETKQLQLGTQEQQRYAYDAVGNRTRYTHANGEVIVYQYDDANRLISLKTFTTAAQATAYEADAQSQSPLKTLSFSYNAKGQYTGYSDSNSSEVRNYNQRGELQSTTIFFGSFSKTQSYTYYPNGLMDTYTSGEGQTYSYSYNKNNQITHVTIAGKGVFQWNGYNWLAATTLNLPGGSSISYDHDSLLREQQRSLSNPGGQSIEQVAYSYDAESNITQIQKTTGNAEQAQDHDYQYDDLYRLTGIQSPVENTQYQYDGVGNRTQATQIEGTDESQTSTIEDGSYNANNQLEAYGNASYRYDANGNTTERIDIDEQALQFRKTQYVYDAQQRLINIKVATTNGTYTLEDLNNKTQAELQVLTQALTPQSIASYVYNGYGQRIKKQTTAQAPQGQTTTYYLYSEQGLAAEYDGSGNVIVEYHYKPQSTWMTNPISQIRNGTLYMYYNDHLGTPQRLIKTNGNTVWAAESTAFGEATIQTNTIANNLRFPGQYYDEETQTHYNYYRDYDPSLGRYLQADPIGLRGGLNVYLYSFARPLTIADFLGLAPGDKYPSGDAAGKAAVKEANCQSRKDNLEYAGRVYKNSDGTYSYTAPNQGTEEESWPGGIPDGTEDAGDYHTHGAEKDPKNENFSDEDILGNEKSQTPGYLGTPQGRIKKYDPKKNRVTSL